MSIGRKLTLAFVVVLASMALVGAVSMFGTARLIQTSRAVARSHDVLQGIDALMLALRDAETGQRGYLLTGKEDYLAPYTAALGTIDRLLVDLRSLSANDAGLRQRISRVEELLRSKLEEL